MKFSYKRLVLGSGGIHMIPAVMLVILKIHLVVEYSGVLDGEDPGDKAAWPEKCDVEPCKCVPGTIAAVFSRKNAMTGNEWKKESSHDKKKTLF